ncbi:uncharacterized protein LOC122259792 [Penaeus japonicus]|uniref:uncharacterized protein LOC122259792 n=1 Tax=Penaeus japonicus TaxID=27405 RepID=UPI001C713D6E|nr:uncharacterized protein LOC122259792 [Penaeus japonicus]
MKAIILLAALSIGIASASSDWCTCAPFASFEHSEIMVYYSKEFTIDNCINDVLMCRTKCRQYFEDNTNGGDLWHPIEGATVGQHICNYVFTNDLMPFLMHKKVHGYYQVCGGAWQYAEVTSKDALCCELGSQKHCTEM